MLKLFLTWRVCFQGLTFIETSKCPVAFACVKFIFSQVYTVNESEWILTLFLQNCALWIWMDPNFFFINHRKSLWLMFVFSLKYSIVIGSAVTCCWSRSDCKFPSVLNCSHSKMCILHESQKLVTSHIERWETLHEVSMVMSFSIYLCFRLPHLASSSPTNSQILYDGICQCMYTQHC